MFKFNELKTVHLEISTRCQAACPMCPRNYKGGLENPNLKIADWSYEDFVKIFDTEVLQQLSGIYFCGNFGDPIMNNDLIAMCQHIKDNAYHIDVRIHTNGGARNTVWWGNLAAALPNNHRVVFALDGLEDTHHLYRIGTVYETVERNAKTFIQAGGNAEWVFIKFKHNQHQVEEAQLRSRQLGFKHFTIKNTIRFVGENKFSVLDKNSNIVYYLEPPTDFTISPIDEQAVINFKQNYKEFEIDCYAKNNREVYIDAHKNLYPCCFLASAPYNNSKTPTIIQGIRENMLKQYYDMIESLGGLDSINVCNRSVKDILSDNKWHTVWDDYWGDKKLMTCSRVCGKTNFSKPKDQFVQRIVNE